MSAETLTPQPTVMEQPFVQSTDTLKRHRKRITAPPRAFSHHDEERGRACIGDVGRPCAARWAVFECWDVAPALHGDGTVICSVVQYADPTP